MSRLLFLLAALFALHADAGEYRLLGTLTSTGASVNNSTTGVPFVIPLRSKITVVCDTNAAAMLTDSLTVTVANGLPLAVAEKLPTSTGSSQKVFVGGVESAVVAVISATGTANCRVWLRQGDE